MPTRNISRTTSQATFIDRMVRTGTYQNASEAVRDALRLLQRRRLEDAARLKNLRRWPRCILVPTTRTTKIRTFLGTPSLSDH